MNNPEVDRGLTEAAPNIALEYINRRSRTSRYGMPSFIQKIMIIFHLYGTFIESIKIHNVCQRYFEYLIAVRIVYSRM